MWCLVTDVCEDVESKHKIGEIIDELIEKKPEQQAKNVTPVHRHSRRSAPTTAVSRTSKLVRYNGTTVRALYFRPSGHGFDSGSGRHQGT